MASISRSYQQTPSMKSSTPRRVSGVPGSDRAAQVPANSFRAHGALDLEQSMPAS